MTTLQAQSGRLRFGTKSMFLAVTVFAVLLAVYPRVRRWYAQRSITEAEWSRIELDNGYALWARHGGYKSLRHLIWLEDLEALHLDGAIANGNQLKHIAKLTRLKGLNLSMDRISDDDLQHLKELKNLEVLDLSGNAIDGSGLVHFDGLVQLRVLNLDCTSVDDQAVANITKLKSLEELHLGATKMTSAGILSLTKLKNLKFLKVERANISDKAIEQFKNIDHLERCTIRIVDQRDSEQYFCWSPPGLDAFTDLMFRLGTDRIVDEFLAERIRRPIVVILIDSIGYGSETMICVLGVSQTGRERVLSIRQGTTENAAEVADVLEDLCDRGIDTGQTMLFVTDGSKTLRTEINRVWGCRAIIQHCQVHKLSNVVSRTPKVHRAELQRRIHEAYAKPNYKLALTKLKETAQWLSTINPEAAATLSDDMEETLTVIRLGVLDELRETLCSTNLIASSINRARTKTSHVKRWRDGDMRQRWCIAEAVSRAGRFDAHRVDGSQDMSNLVKALESELDDVERKGG